MLVLSGKWRVRHGLSKTDSIQAELSRNTRLRCLAFQTRELSSWDSMLLSFLMRLRGVAAERGLELDTGALPRGAQRLFALALAVSERANIKRQDEPKSFAAIIGQCILAAFRNLSDTTAFIGLQQAQTTFESANNLLADDGPTIQNLNAALEEVESAARSIQNLVETIECNPTMFLRGR